MRFYTAILVAVVLFGVSGSRMQAIDEKTDQNHSSYTVYANDEDKAGVDVKVDAASTLSLETAMQQDNLNRKIRLQAKVEDVCRVKGCWVVLTDGKNTMRVTFKDYGFFVPKDVVGKTIVADGIITETIISEADAQHYAEDAGASEEEIMQIVGDRKELSMVADAVLIPE
jgi:hypothetical protein